MAKSVLDLYELYRLVVGRGGLVDVINKKLWQEVIKGLNLPSSITSAAFTLRTQYMKFLYRYECHKLGLSTPSELQVAIEGNKREGRRTSYYGDIAQIQSPNSNGAANNGHQGSGSQHPNQSQMSPVSMVPTSTLNSISNRLQVNGHSNHYGTNSSNTSIPTNHGLSPLILQGAGVPLPPENRIIDYIKLMNNRMLNNPVVNGSPPEMQEASNLAGLDAQIALWNFYSGVVKQPLQQNPILPFQPARPQSQNSTIEGPLDLGKNSRKREGSISETPSTKVRVCNSEGADEDEVNESNISEDSESDDEPECHVPVKNSSQGSNDKIKLSPIVVKMKINGTNYKGTLRPTSNKIKFS